MSLCIQSSHPVHHSVSVGKMLIYVNTNYHTQKISQQVEGREIQVTLIQMKNSERQLGLASRKHT